MGEVLNKETTNYKNKNIHAVYSKKELHIKIYTKEQREMLKKLAYWHNPIMCKEAIGGDN